MKRIIALVLTAVVVASCAKETKNLTIKGTVDGLRKGRIYLQKHQDSTTVNVDSIEIKGDPNFQLSTDIEGPEMLTLYLDKNDGNNLNDQLDIFAEPGVLTVETSRDYFAPEAKVSGSKSHEKWNEYQQMHRKFRDANLDLIKEILEANKNGDSLKIDSLQQRSEQNATRSILYTLNFVLNNTDSYVAPYITLADAYNTNVKYLDSIAGKLTPEVADSKYGKMLQSFIEEVKAQNDSIN